MPIFRFDAASPQPSPQASPRPDGRPVGSPSRLAAVQSNVRSLLRGSSVYSQSPAIGSNSNNGTPKLPLLGFLRRPNQPPSPNLSESSDEDLYNEPPPRLASIQTQHTAGSYVRTIGRQEHHEHQDHREYRESYSAPASPVYAVPAPESALMRQNSDYGHVDPETEQLAAIAHERRRRRRRRHHRQRQAHGWVRMKADKERGCWASRRRSPTRNKTIMCILSAIFLALILTIYLSLALTRPHIGQEVHVMFVLVILVTTIFFCHSLIRLCMLHIRPSRRSHSSHARIPEMTGPEGFQPVQPIRVHLARDEEIAVGDEIDSPMNGNDGDVEKVTETVKQPPPAYGLWRCSVRVDPNLLHWQRNPDSVVSSNSSSRRGSAERPTTQDGPRPPSYISDDGVTYVVQAVPRTFAPAPGAVDVHPAYRGS